MWYLWLEILQEFTCHVELEIHDYVSVAFIRRGSFD